MDSKSKNTPKNGLSDEDRLSNVLYHFVRIRHILKYKKDFESLDKEILKEAITYNLYRIGLEIRKIKNIKAFKLKKVDLFQLSMLIPEIIASQELQDVFNGFREDSGKLWLNDYIEDLYIALNPDYKPVSNRKRIIGEFGYLRENNSVWTVKKK